MRKTGTTIINSMFWSVFERISTQGVGLLISIILARLIAPEEYGIIAAVSIFTSIATTFVSGGLGNALIQKKDADDIDYATLFTFNTVFSLLVYFIIYCSAPCLVRLLNQSYDYIELVRVLRFLGIGVVLASFNSFFRAILTKRLQFKKLFLLTLIGTLMSATVGIFLAYRGFGVWALVAQNLLSYFFNTVFFMTSSQWKPHFCFSILRFKPMFSFGFKLMFSGLLITLYSELTGLVIANQHTSEELAYYKKGMNFPKLLVLNIITSINTTLFPVMSNIDDEKELKKLVRQFNRQSAFIITPMMFGFAAIGPSFVNLILTEKWMPCLVFLQITCMNYAIQPICMSSLQYLKASGKATEYLVLDIIRKMISVVLLTIAIFSRKGVVAIAFSEVISNFIAIFINMYPGKKHINYLIREQILDVLPKFIISSIMFVVVYGVGMLNIPVFLKLVIQICIGIIIYCLIAKLLNMKELKEIKALIMKLFQSIKMVFEKV